MSPTLSMVLVTIYFAITLGISFYAVRFVKTTVEDYYLAGRGMGWFVGFWTMIASTFSAFVFLGLAGQNYRTGMGMAVILVLAYAFGIPLAIIGPRLWVLGKRYKYYTPGDWFEDRFESRGLKTCVAAIQILFLVPYMTAQIYGAALILRVITGQSLSLPVAVAYVSLFNLAIVLIAGFRSVIWVDTFQGIMAAVTIVGGFSLVASRLGGMTALISKVAEIDPTLLSFPGTTYYYTPAMWFSWIIILGTALMYPYLWQRIYAFKSLKTLWITFALWGLGGWILELIPGAFAGLAGRVVFPGLQGAATDQVFMMLLAKFSPLLMIIAACAGFSLIVSTTDSQLLSVGTIAVRDIVESQKRGFSETYTVLVTRCVVAVFALIVAYFAVLNVRTIALLVTSASAITAQFFPSTVLGLYWRRMTRAGAWSGLLAGVCTVIVLMVGLGALDKPIIAGFHSVVPAILLNTALIVGVSMVTKPVSEETMERHFGIFTRPARYTSG